jgi:hypothetical protein
MSFMIFKVELTILLCEPYQPKVVTNHSDTDFSSKAYRVENGVNAKDISSAITLASEKMSNSVNKDGRYLGGLVLDVRARCVDISEYKPYSEYFLQEIETPGVFYVSGLTFFTPPMRAYPDVEHELEQYEQNKGCIDRDLVYIHESNDKREKNRRIRIICPVCGAWKEHSHLGFISMFIEGFGANTPEEHDWIENRKEVMPFIEQHLPHCRENSEMIRILDEVDEEFYQLEPFNESR